MTVHIKDFSFADHAQKFDEHITDSIPSYDRLREKCVGLSRWFIQKGTTVLDIGCTTGSLLRCSRDANQPTRPDVSYVGVDNVPEYGDHWRENEASNVKFAVADARSYEGYQNIGLALSLFTVQFIPAPDKLGVLQKIYDGLAPGGALLIAEKVLATNARFQEMLTAHYYDFKRRKFTNDQIFGKEQSLRGVMTCWPEEELDRALRTVGFEETQTIWMDFPFKAILALKP